MRGVTPDSFREIIDTARRHNIGIGIVLFPDTGPALDATYPFEFRTGARAHAFARKRVFAALICDATSPMWKIAASLWVSPLDHHPERAGQRDCGSEDFEAFQSHWVK